MSKGLYQHRLLIVDDSHTQRSVLQQHAQDWGMHIVLAGNATTVLEQLQSQQPMNIDIALVDHHMPTLNGLEFVQTCRENPQFFVNSSFPVILLTAISDELDSYRLSSLKILAKLSKPLSIVNLYKILTKILCPLDTTPVIHTPVMVTTDSVRHDLRILVVEDNFMNRDVIEGMLKRLGYHADMAENGQKALDILEKNHYDLIFMDCEMPVMDGYTATKVIRQRELVQADFQNQHIPIIALTAYADQAHRCLCQSVGMDDYMTKPIRLGILRSVLNHWSTVSATLLERPNLMKSHPVTDETNETTATLSTIDHKELEHLDHIMGEGTAKLFAKRFMEYAPQQLAEMQQSLTNREADTLRRKAHQFKGESLQIGAIQLGALCKEVEKKAQMGQLDTIVTDLDNIEAEIKRINTSLLRICVS